MEDPKDVICQEHCTKELSCGHKCPKLCSEPCEKPGDICKVFVPKRLPGCGHVRRLQCWEDPAKVGCVELCKKKLKCGHTCPNACWQPCESGKRCSVKVYKKITKCGHTAKVPCHLDPDSGFFCSTDCTEVLECGHQCKEKCGKPCTKLCKAKVPLKYLPCKHPARNIECHVDPTTVECTERCATILDCGHDCKNVCGECYHNPRRVAGKDSICAEFCNRRLKCRHQCRSKCRDCFGGRIHQHCKASVDVTLVCGCKVKEQCCKVLSAEHGSAKAKGFCLLQYGLPRRHVEDIQATDNSCEHNPVTGYCKEPCKELLPCKHPCIGICGEPCLDLCRFCNRREVLKIFPEFQADHDPCYIKLQECRDIFELTDLEQKLSISSRPETSAPVLPITCPKCGRAIREKRFNKHSATVKKDVFEIDRLLQEEKRSEVENARKLLSRSKYKQKPQSQRINRNDRRRPRKCSLMQTVSRKPQRDMVWKMEILEDIKTYDQFQLAESNSQISPDQCIEQCRRAKASVLQEIRRRLEKILDDNIFLTEQLAEDFGCELERLRLCYGLEILWKDTVLDWGTER